MSDRVFLGHTTVLPTATLTRPAADTTQYTAGDVLGTAIGANPTTHVITLPGVARSAGGSGMLTSLLLIDSANQATPPSLEAWIFSAAPVAQADNTPFAVSDAELANLIGIIPLSTARIANPSVAAAGSLAIQSDVATMPFKCGGGLIDLYLVLVVRNAYTPVAGEAFTVKAGALQDY